ncbi:SAGA HAT/Core module component [Lignoscripta atroalba]|nr:SAGA HAT/Core module component [Lignoscripta atroalba]
MASPSEPEALSKQPLGQEPERDTEQDTEAVAEVEAESSSTPPSQKSLPRLAVFKDKVLAEAKQKWQASEANTNTMAARNRPRTGLAKEDHAHEEQAMWNQIVIDLKKCKAIRDKAAEVSQKIIELNESIGKSPSLKEIDELGALTREGVKLAEEEQKMLNEEPADLIKNIEILKALRNATESEPPRNPAPSKARKPKAPKLEMDGAADSPGPSPSVSTSASRLKGSSVRSGSVASARDSKEAPVKIEEGGSEGTKGPFAERAGKFFVGAEVAYKQTKMKEDGSQWIQCIIIAITETGNKKRYEVQDPEPDESGAPGQIYKTSAAALIAIPPSDSILPEYPAGKHVLARYPETTTFYRAEVTGVDKKGVCRLKFEDDQNQEMEVDRRFVLDFGGGR